MKIFNGRIVGYSRDGFHGYIAARTKKEAVELGKAAFGLFSMNELNNYWCDTWGNPMKGIEPDEPGVWMSDRDGNVWKLVKQGRQ